MTKCTYPETWHALLQEVRLHILLGDEALVDDVARLALVVGGGRQHGRLDLVDVEEGGGALLVRAAQAGLAGGLDVGDDPRLGGRCNKTNIKPFISHISIFYMHTIENLNK